MISSLCYRMHPLPVHSNTIDYESNTIPCQVCRFYKIPKTGTVSSRGSVSGKECSIYCLKEFFEVL